MFSRGHLRKVAQRERQPASELSCFHCLAFKAGQRTTAKVSSLDAFFPAGVCTRAFWVGPGRSSDRLLRLPRMICRSITFALPILIATLGVLPVSPTLGAEEEFPPQPPIQPLSAQEEQKTFQLPPGYRME